MKEFTSDIQHEIRIKFTESGGVVEFHNVSVVEMMAAPEMLRREMERALLMAEVQQERARQNGIQPVAAMPGLKS